MQHNAASLGLGLLALIIAGLGVEEVIQGQASPTVSTITIDGKQINSTTLNFTSGPSIIWICQPVGTSQLNCQNQVNTASILTKNTYQSGACDVVRPAGGTSAYSYSFGPGCLALTSFTTGMHLHFIPDVTNAAGPATLQIDSANQGKSVGIKDRTGNNDLAPNFLIPGQSYPIWYDGRVFRLG